MSSTTVFDRDVDFHNSPRQIDCYFSLIFTSPDGTTPSDSPPPTSLPRLNVLIPPPVSLFHSDLSPPFLPSSSPFFPKRYEARSLLPSCILHPFPPFFRAFCPPIEDLNPLVSLSKYAFLSEEFTSSSGGPVFPQ